MTNFLIHSATNEYPSETYFMNNLFLLSQYPTLLLYPCRYVFVDQSHIENLHPIVLKEFYCHFLLVSPDFAKNLTKVYPLLSDSNIGNAKVSLSVIAWCFQCMLDTRRKR